MRYVLTDTDGARLEAPGIEYNSRVVASESRMGIAARLAEWDCKSDPTPEQRALFLAHNDAIEIRTI